MSIVSKIAMSEETITQKQCRLSYLLGFQTIKIVGFSLAKAQNRGGLSLSD